jgi:hypothetical protein
LIAGALHVVGIGVRPAKGEPHIVSLTSEEIETMSRMEHGRWNVERLMSGWKYGPRRDAGSKLSPFIASWNQIPDKARDYDRMNVQNWPLALAKVGLEIYRLSDT